MGKRGLKKRGSVWGRILGAALTVVLAAGAGLGGAIAATHFRTEAASDFTPPHAAQLLGAATQPAAELTSTVRTCSIQEEVTAPAALDFHGQVTNADTGEILFEHNATGTHPTASVMKLITAASALVTLGPDYRIPTSVYPGDVPGSFVIVGGGDATLKSSATSYYDGATASIEELAQAVQDAGGATAVGYDASLFGGAPWHPTWEDRVRENGNISPITALMTDGGRMAPNSIYSERTATPDTDAAADFASAVGAPVDASINVQPGSEPIIEVWSQPVSELVEYVLVDSDNVLAETLARLVAIERDQGNTFAEVDAGAELSLEELGLDVGTFTGADGSGMSRDNRASSALMVELLQLIDADEFGLGFLKDYLPQNGLTGTLDDRLQNVPAGSIAAKTGWIQKVYSLAGYMETEDGTRLIFAIFVPVADPNGPQNASVTNRNALDAVAAAIWACGGSLSNY